MRHAALITLVFTALAACGGGNEGQTGQAGDAATPAGDRAEAQPAQPGIAGVLSQDERFSLLSAAFEAAGAQTMLDDSRTYTLFAPTDSAFAQLPDGAVEALLDPENRPTLEALLRHHVVPGRLIAVDSGRGTAETMDGASLRLERYGDRLRVGGEEGAVVTAPGIEAVNGVIHGIDRVLLPPEGE